MKKFLALFLATLYFVFANAGLVFASNLYFVKNSTKEKLNEPILIALQNKNYTVQQKDPYYAIYDRDNDEYILIILQKSSNNYFYFIESSNDNTSVNKLILKALKNMNVEYEESFNAQYISMFESQAVKILSKTAGEYIFQEPIQQQTTILNPTITQEQTPNTLRGSVIQVAKGSKFKTYLQTPIDTSSAAVGDEVRAVLSENWVYNGKVIAPQGSMLIGNLSKARHATYGSLNGRVVFSFNTLTTPDGKTYSISTEDVDFTVTNEGKLGSAVSSVLVGAALGALTGLLIGASSKDRNTWATTAISAGVGGAGGAIKVAAEKGVDAEIPVYTELEVSLLKPFSVVTNY